MISDFAAIVNAQGLEKRGFLLYNRIMEKKGLTAGMAEREKQNFAAPGHGWHSAAYHRYFEDYAEFERVDEKGRKRIERVYQGTWYVQTLSRGARLRERLALVGLFLLSVVLFGFAALRPIEGNGKWFLTLAQFASLGLLLWTLTGLFNYLICREKMTVGEYKTGPLRFQHGCVAAVAALILCTLLYLLGALLYEEVWQHLLCALMCLAAALPLLLANRLDANVPYANEQSEKAAPEDAARID